MTILLCTLTPPALAQNQPASTTRLIDRSDYNTRLIAFWRGTCIANWTGLRAEGRRNAPPFFTDADWGTYPFPDRPWLSLDYVLWGNPWNADDDTDIEYVYLHTASALATAQLSPQQITGAWIAHINRSIWVSNASARGLMSRGILPPMTALAQGLAHSVPRTSDDSLMIDAQLTTELFGLLAPGMPERALAIADLPIRTTAAGHALHASQFYVALFSLAPVVDPALSPEAQTLWLLRSARAFIPDTSKAADIADFVLADYLSNPDTSDWERTRDRVYERYQRDAALNGFVHRAWFESSVNFGAGLTALLYGGLDFRRTLRIATLAGWDCDNQAATIAGIVAFLRAHEFNADLGWTAQTYRWSTTRDALTDHLPDDPNAEDTFTLMARRMLPLIDAHILGAGGFSDPDLSASPDQPVTGRWLLPPSVPLDPTAAIAFNPTHALMLRSATRLVRADAGAVSAHSNIPGTPSPGFGSGIASLIADAVEHDFTGVEPLTRPGAAAPGYLSTQRSPPDPASSHTFSVTYDRPVIAHTIRLIEGDRFSPPAHTITGGGCPSPSFELLINGAWTPAALAAPVPPDPVHPFAVRDVPLASPVQTSGVRCTCAVQSTGPESPSFATVLELDLLTPPMVFAAPTFDRNADASLTVEDLYAFIASPVDLTGDGDTNSADIDLLTQAVRFTETRDMTASHR